MLAALLGAAQPSLADPTPNPADVRIKADYLYRLVAFVRWPVQAPADFQICISGRADIAATLAALVHDQQADGRKITVVDLTPDRAQAASECRVLFIGRDTAAAQAMLDATASSPVLTVADRDAGTKGGVVEFMTGDGKIRLAVNRNAAAAHMLELSSKLLDVAAEVAP